MSHLFSGLNRDLFEVFKQHLKWKSTKIVAEFEKIEEENKKIYENLKKLMENLRKSGKPRQIQEKSRRI